MHRSDAARRRDRAIKHDVTQADVDNAVRIARVFGANVPHLVDEFESAAVAALDDAARGFDPTLGHAFRTYAYRVVVGAIQDAARSWKPKGFRRAPDAPVVTTFSAVELEDGSSPDPAAEDEPPVGWEIERADEIAGLSRRLPPPWQDVFRAALAYPTQAAAGRAVGLSESRVSQIMDATTHTLRERFAGLSCEEDLLMTGSNGVALDAPRHRDRGIEGDAPPRKTKTPPVINKPMQFPVTPPPEPEPEPEPEKPEKGAPCPDCGNPRNPSNNRCYHCRPGGPRPRAAGEVAAPSPKSAAAKPRLPAPAPAAADLFGRELDAVRVVHDALAGLPGESAAWVLQAVGRHYPLPA